MAGAQCGRRSVQPMAAWADQNSLSLVCMAGNFEKNFCLVMVGGCRAKVTDVTGAFVF